MKVQDYPYFRLTSNNEYNIKILYSFKKYKYSIVSYTTPASKCKYFTLKAHSYVKGELSF